MLYRCQQLLREYEVVHLSEITRLPQGKKFLTDQRNNLPRGGDHMRIARRMSDITILKNVADLFASNVVKELVVAIDPGYSIGIAILANDAPILTNIQISLEKSIVWIKRQLDELNYTNLQIKIGDGWKETLEEYVMRFSQEFGNYAEILLVDEVNTSIKLKQELGIHERAAIAIGLREGRPV